MYRAHRLQLQGQPRIRIGPANIACPFPTVFHNYALSGTGACMSSRIMDPQRARFLMAIARNANPSRARFIGHAPQCDDFGLIQQGFHYVWRTGCQPNHDWAFANRGIGSGKPTVLRPAIAFRWRDAKQALDLARTERLARHQVKLMMELSSQGLCERMIGSVELACPAGT